MAINVCWQCGQYHADKIIDPTGPYAICPECNHAHLFKQQPLFLVCGPSGAGKSTILQEILGQFNDVVVLEGDILLMIHPTEEEPHRHYDSWLRVAKNIGQAGRPVVLFSAGAIPPNVEPCVERRYFSATHYLAIVADDEALSERLRQRPAWRNSSSDAFIAEHVKFNQWLKANATTASPPFELLDTTKLTLEESTTEVVMWIKGLMARA